MDDKKEDHTTRDIILILLAFLFGGASKYYFRPVAYTKTKSDDKKKEGTKIDETIPPTEKPKETPSTSRNIPATLLKWTTGAIVTVSLGIFALGRYSASFPAASNPVVSDNDLSELVDVNKMPDISHLNARDERSSENLGVTLPTVPPGDIDIVESRTFANAETVNIISRRNQVIKKEPSGEDILQSVIKNINNTYQNLETERVESLREFSANENINISSEYLKKQVENTMNVTKQVENTMNVTKQVENMMNVIKEERESLGISDVSAENKIEDEIQKTFETIGKINEYDEEEIVPITQEEIEPIMVDLSVNEETIGKINEYAEQEMSAEQLKQKLEQEKQNAVNDFKEKFIVSQSLRKLKLPNFNPSLDELFDEAGSILLIGNTRVRKIFYKLISDALNKTGYSGISDETKKMIISLLNDFVTNLTNSQHTTINFIVTELKKLGFQNWDAFKLTLKIRLSDDLRRTINLFLLSVKRNFKIARVPKGFNQNIVNLIKNAATNDINKIIEIFESGRNKIIGYLKILNNERTVQLFFETYIEKTDTLYNTLYHEALKIYYSYPANPASIRNNTFFTIINTFLSSNAARIKYDKKIKRLNEIFKLLSVLEEEKKLLPTLNMGTYVSIALYSSMLYKLLVGEELSVLELIQIEKLYKLPYIRNLGVFFHRAGYPYIEDISYK